MRLRDYLSIPYLLEAYSVEAAPGLWTRHVSYPELPECEAEAEDLEDAIDALERTRMRTILRLLRDGQQPPVPRTPLAAGDPAGLSRELGLGSEIIPFLDHEEAEMRDTHASGR